MHVEIFQKGTLFEWGKFPRGLRKVYSKVARARFLQSAAVFYGNPFTSVRVASGKLFNNDIPQTVNL